MTDQQSVLDYLKLVYRGLLLTPDTIAVLNAMTGDEARATIEVISTVQAVARAEGREEEKAARRRRRERKRERDTAQLAKDTSRFLRQGLARRAGEDQDLEALTALLAQLKEGHWLLDKAVLALRMDGISDRNIGIALGVAPKYARQEVHRRFGKRPPPSTPAEAR